MPVRKLPRTTSMEELRKELAFTMSALKAEPDAKHLVQKLVDLLKEWGRVHDMQLALWDAQMEASVQVTRADQRMKDLMEAVNARLLVKVGGNRKAYEYVLYVPEKLSALKRPVLGDQLELVRTWPQFLEKESDPNLKTMAEPAKASVGEADAAVEASDNADAANREFRLAGDLAQFHQKVEDTRDELFRALDEIRQQKKFPRDYASTFFRKRVEELSKEERKARAEARVNAREAAKKLEEQKRAARKKFLDAKREMEAISGKKRPAA